MMASVDNEWCNVRKFINNQLRAMSYRVKKDHCYHVPCYQHKPSFGSDSISQDELDDDLTLETYIPPQPTDNPVVPAEIGQEPEVEAPPEVVHEPEVEAPPEVVVLPTNNDINESSAPQRRSQRQRHRPRYLEDYAC